MKKDFNPRLMLRKDKKRKKDGKMPLCVLFSYPRTKGIKFALGYSFTDEEWSKIENLPKDNVQREVIATELNRIKKELAICSIKGLTVTRETLGEIVKNEFSSDPMEKDFLDFFEKFIERKRTMVRQNTYDSYKQSRSNLRRLGIKISAAPPHQLWRGCTPPSGNERRKANPTKCRISLPKILE